MASDRARISSDPRRGYRAIVYQQGRVTLEADGNEATRLAETALREDVIDIVGVSGTPDDGYEVTSTGLGFQVGPGTYYLGGWRVTLDAAMPVGNGPDALDLPAAALPAGDHAICLLLTEQEVSATEDRVLREVALGGPDSAQRTRLMQRAVALASRGADCDASASAIAAALAEDGATFDPKTGAILPDARLQVSLVAAPSSGDPCDPPATGGYLGADNQLIRVSVVRFDKARQRGTLVWAYDNASTIYRAATSDGAVIALEGEPVDPDHAPRLNQAVEILQTRALFDHGELVAADSGLVTHVSRAYDPDLRSLETADTLAVADRGSAARPILLRLWEETVDFVPGTPVELGKTGLAVTLSLSSFGEGVAARPYWCFAARPSTPIIVYPRRVLDAPQPPEGPRQWLAPLATGTVRGRQTVVADDCRDTFVPLTEIRPGCCGIVVEPTMAGRRDFLQKALDRLAGTRGSLTLKPGRYKLRKPLRLTNRHDGLTIEGCSEGVFLEADDEADPDFFEGLIVLDEVNEVTLRNLQFQMPVVPASKTIIAAVGVRGRQQLFSSIAVLATGCAQLIVTGCQFRFRLPQNGSIIAVALLLRGECWGLTLRRNRFLHDTDIARAPGVLAGVILTPALATKAGSRLAATRFAQARIDALLDAGSFSDNEFAGLSAAALLFGRLGSIRIERNRVHGCVSGFLLQESGAAALLAALGQNAARLLPLDTLTLVMALAAAIPGADRENDAGHLTSTKLRAIQRAAAVRARGLIAGFQFESDVETGSSATISIFSSLAAAVSGLHTPLEPLFHIAGNDIDVFGRFPGETTNAAANRAVQGVPGLLVAIEPLEEPHGDVIATANRLVSKLSPSVSILTPHRLVFSSNIVAAAGSRRAAALLILAGGNRERALMEVMANVVVGRAQILPNQHPVPPSQDWEFMNHIA